MTEVITEDEISVLGLLASSFEAKAVSHDAHVCQKLSSAQSCYMCMSVHPTIDLPFPFGVMRTRGQTRHWLEIAVGILWLVFAEMMLEHKHNTVSLVCFCFLFS